MILEIATTLNRLMMYQIIFIKKKSRAVIHRKRARLKRIYIREKTILKANTQEKKMMIQRLISLKRLRVEKMPSMIEKRKI